ncbi:MAG: glycosyltransferase family 39 protein [Deltaproteobacteria bacterium]|nr:glycosyltransferase family 39 protein [Deltaproteobacteria bacterium]
MTPSLIAFVGASAALVLALGASLRRPASRALTHPATLGAVVLFAVSMIVRAGSVEPTLVHADVVAPELVDCVLQAPRACATRGASYGPYGFLVLGALTRPFGDDLNAVFRAMALVGALNVALLAVLAGRLSGSPYGALFAVAVAGTNPVFMRVAGSEDMHNVGLLLALVALIVMDVHAMTRRAAPLAAAVLALGLLVHTRQTFYVVVPCAFVLGLARGGRGLLGSSGFLAAGLVVVVVLVSRIAANAASGGLVQQMAGVFLEPVLLPTILRHHALLDVGRFGALPALTVAAVIWACRDGRMARAAALAFALNFVVTYPCGMPSPGVELAQRLSVVAFGMLLVAMAGAAAVEGRVPERWRVVVGLGAAGVLTALPPFFPGWRVLAGRTPIHREYLAVASAAAALPNTFTLVKAPTAEATVHGYARYAGLLERTGRHVRVVPARELAAAPRPWIFLEDVECWTYSFRELTGAGDDRPTGPMAEVRWDKVLFGRQVSPIRPPAGMRPECRRIERDGTPIGPRGVISGPEDDPPFLFYAGSEVPIQFYELRAGAAG